MCLIFGIVGCNIHRIVSKLSDPLKSRRTKCAAHRGMHIAVEIISRIIFVNRFRFVGEAFQV
ncbi:hypothetical protein D3C73_467620 [compost metagenome]